MSAIILFKTNLIRQTRTGVFLLIILLSIFAGFLCVPAPADGYQIFYLNGIRGIYNSAWLGALSALLPSILLWLPGFYLLRSQISEDRRLNIGQVTAAAPVSKLRYIAGKAASNFIVLAVLQLLFTAALMAMQLIRQESSVIRIGDYLVPFLFIAVPSLLILAALTVFFDVVPWLRGTFGNVVIFILWLILSLVSLESPGHLFDVFGVGIIIRAMAAGARLAYPGIPADAGSFGYYQVPADAPSFVWDGLGWDAGFLQSRAMLAAAAVLLVIAASLVFNRFRESTQIKTARRVGSRRGKSPGSVDRKTMPLLSPVRKSRNALGPILAEVRILLTGRSRFWYIAVLLANAAVVLATPATELKWLACFLFLLLPQWGESGCRERMYFTSEMIYSGCSKTSRWLNSWIAGCLTAVILSSGFLIRFVMLNQLAAMFLWLIGLLFITTLALTLGTLCGNRRCFEAVFTALFYFGTFSGVQIFDCFGIYSNHALLYLLITLGLLLGGLALTFRRKIR